MGLQERDTALILEKLDRLEQEIEQQGRRSVIQAILTTGLGLLLVGLSIFVQARTPAAVECAVSLFVVGCAYIAVGLFLEFTGRR